MHLEILLVDQCSLPTYACMTNVYAIEYGKFTVEKQQMK